MKQIFGVRRVSLRFDLPQSGRRQDGVHGNTADINENAAADNPFPALRAIPKWCAAHRTPKTLKKERHSVKSFA